MTTPTPPAWTRSAQRLDRPDLDVWWKPEQHGPLDGILIWQGDLPDRRTGQPYRVFAIRDDAAGGIVHAVTERAALRSLRQAKIGSRVYIAPGGVRDIGDGKRVREFVVYAQDMEVAAAPLSSSPATASASAAASPTAATSNGVAVAGDAGDAGDAGADVDDTRIPF